MAYYNRFGDNYEQGMRSINERRDALVDKIMQHKPENLAELMAKNPYDAFSLELNWVKVPDPRKSLEDPDTIEVLPVLSAEYFGDEGENLDITSLLLVGKLPSGEEQPIGNMGTGSATPKADPFLFVYMETDRPAFTRWDSADAELFLKIAEDAIYNQPS